MKPGAVGKHRERDEEDKSREGKQERKWKGEREGREERRKKLINFGHGGRKFTEFIQGFFGGGV